MVTGEITFELSMRRAHLHMDLPPTRSDNNNKALYLQRDRISQNKGEKTPLS